MFRAAARFTEVGRQRSEMSSRPSTLDSRPVWQQAELLVAKAHTICPNSKATRGNIEVTLLANGKPIASG